tara:strand:+ start:888 stop:1373 length:486 start_codon:yes stop_codon:yes gene_type:complete
MANKLIMKCSVEPQIDASETVDSKAYQSYHVDQVGSHGGTIETSYTDAKAIKYVGVIDKKTSDGATALTDGALAFEGTATTTGTEPGANGVKAFYVKYDSTLGTVASVTVTYEDNTHAVLSVGEACLVPLSGGALAECKIHASDYVDGTNEATVTVVLIGD